MTLFYSGSVYVHYKFENFLNNTRGEIGSDLYQLLQNNKSTIMQNYISRLNNEADKRVYAAFGNAGNLEEIKHELFGNNANDENSVQKKLEAQLSKDSVYLMRHDDRENDSLQFLASMSAKNRKIYIQQKINENRNYFEKLCDLVKKYIEYYDNLIKEQESLLFGMSMQDKKIEGYLKKKFRTCSSIPESYYKKQKSDLRNAIKDYNALISVSQQLKQIESASSIEDTSKKIGGLSSFFKAAGGRYGELTTLHALDVALSDGDKQTAEKLRETFKTGDISGSLFNSSFLSGRINTVYKEDSTLSGAMGSDYNRQIKTDVISFYTTKSGTNGIIEITNKNYGYYGASGTQALINLQADVQFLSMIQTNASILGSLANPVFYYNLNAGHGSKTIRDNTLNKYWKNYRQLIVSLGFMDYMFGHKSRITAGNNSIFMVIGERIISIYDIIKAVTKYPQMIVAKGLDKIGRTAQENVWIGYGRKGRIRVGSGSYYQGKKDRVLAESRSESAGRNVERVLQQMVDIKLNIAAYANTKI